MSAPNARTRSKITLNPARVVSSSLSSNLSQKLFFANLLSVIALEAGKDWLLTADLGIFWTLIRVLVCGSFGALVLEVASGRIRKWAKIEWSVLGVASVLVFVQLACLLTALYRLSLVRVILFTNFSFFWTNAIVARSSNRRALVVVLAFLFSFLSDVGFATSNAKGFLPAYGALILHGISSGALDHTLGVLSPAMGARSASCASTLGATIICLPFYALKVMMFDERAAPRTTSLAALFAIPLVACSHLFVTPETRTSVHLVALPSQYFPVSFLSTTFSAFILGPLVFSHFPSWTDLVVAPMLFYGMYLPNAHTLTGPPRTPAMRLYRSYLKTVLSNPESRKIFYFLMLNLSYMLIQMLYGVWTNSLGLISDAIHMAFDCMAIAMGLFASVMATWPPNERFTYGYGRIETLSGFANGIFLILISIFIVFEAIQRIIDPPDMNTSQLLLVSSLGLAVNLFGMFAMGGHHHHGHSHSHGHSHGGHGHSHGPSTGTPSSASHAQAHSHDREEGHGHGHGHSHLPSAHSHSHSHSQHAPPPIVLERGNCEDHGHSHQLAPPIVLQTGDEEHSHRHDHDHEKCEEGHVHAHSHSHSPPSWSHSHSHSPLHTHSQSQRAAPRPLPLSASRHHSASHDFPKATCHAHSMSLHIEADPSNLSVNSVYGSAHGHGRKLGRPHTPEPLSLSPLSPVSPNSAHSTHSHVSNSSIIALPVSPLTPSYTFGQDDHFVLHHQHQEERSPNLHHPELHVHSHDEGHAHAHGEGHSHNMRGVFLHVMADTLGSVGVIISTLLIQFYGWTGFDPIASLFIAILIAASVIPLVIDCGRVLCLDVGDKADSIKHALDDLNSVDGLAKYSSPRFWPKDASSMIGSIHIHVAPFHYTDPTAPHSLIKASRPPIDRIIERVDLILRSRISGLEELTIQVAAVDR